jgi:hypothetical protein
MFESWKRTFISGGTAMILAAATTGCGVFSDDDKDNDRRSDRSGRIDTMSRVPASAEVVAEGRSRDLSYKADEDGRLYLYDASDDRLINSWDVKKGQRLTVSPDNNAISLEGRPISSSTALSGRSNYRLLFDERD